MVMWGLETRFQSAAKHTHSARRRNQGTQAIDQRRLRAEIYRRISGRWTTHGWSYMVVLLPAALKPGSIAALRSPSVVKFAVWRPFQLLMASPAFSFLQIDALVPLPAGVEGFVRVSCELCPPFSAQARPSRATPAVARPCAPRPLEAQRSGARRLQLPAGVRLCRHGSRTLAGD